MKRQRLLVTVLASGGPSDTTRPTVAITCAQTSPTGAATLNMTFTLSESSTTFTIADITVGNGSAGNFAGSGTSYTCDVTPTAAGTVTVDVLADAFTDAAGNGNTASDQFSITVTLPFEDLFTRANGDLANGWTYTAGKWTVASNAAVGTPALGANVLTNSTFAVDANWGKGTGWTIGSGVATKAAGTGSDLTQGLTGNRWYRLEWDLVTRTAGLFWTGYWWVMWAVQRSSAGSYVDTGFISTSVALGLITTDGAAAGTVDNVQAKQITTADMFATRNFLTANINISTPVTMNPATQSGLVMCLDNATTPANYIAAYLAQSGGRLILIKCVAGTVTELIGANVTYVANRVIRLTKLGTTVKLYYNEVQIGTDQTVSDAGIKDNTIHGMMSTDVGNSMASFTANPT
jgi:hypothetical protein